MNINSQELYKAKYLKYKQKYLELKGGKICPNVGFHQHIGECWHDSYSMLMLYTDNISDNIQNVLENYTKSFESIEDLVEDILNFAENNENLKIYLPLNIDSSVYDKFKKYSRNYITNLFKRYLNEKLKLAKDVIVPKKKKAQEMGLVRQASFRESLMCTSSVFNILNLNNLEKKEIDLINEAGLHEKNLYFITCLLNYYLMNYILPDDLKRKTPEEIKEIPENYIYNQFVNFNVVFDTKVGSKDLISRLTQIKETINNCDGINIGVLRYNPKLSPEGMFIVNEEYSLGHMLCMFTCDKKEYFFDNEGIHLYKQLGGEGTEINTQNESLASLASVASVAESDVKEAVEKRFGEGVFDVHDAVNPREIFKSFTEFKWKKYFSDTIDKIIIEIKKNQEIKKPQKEYYGLLRESLSLFLRSNEKYKNVHIENIQLYKHIKFEKGKTIAQKETTYYAGLIKALDYWYILDQYKIDSERIDNFIENNNTKMLDLLFKSEYNREYLRAYLKTINKTDLLKDLEKKIKL